MNIRRRLQHSGHLSVLSSSATLKVCLLLAVTCALCKDAIKRVRFLDTSTDQQSIRLRNQVVGQAGNGGAGDSLPLPSSPGVQEGSSKISPATPPPGPTTSTQQLTPDAGASTAGSSRGWFEPGAQGVLEVLTGFANQTPHFAPAPQLRPELLHEKKVASTILVKIATGHYLGPDFERTPLKCSYRGLPLRCRYEQGADAATADALWFHLPHVRGGAGLPKRAFPGQALVAFSMEGSGYYPQVDDASFIALFDYRMTYHLAADVPVIYPPFDIRASNESALPSFQQRRAAVVYINSNCSPLNHREEIMRALNSTHHVPIDSMGRCMHNTEEAPGGKVENQKNYRVCVALENSNSRDYVTEKSWDAFQAGCVPVYLGAPNAAADFFPSEDSVIWVERYPKLEDLAAEIFRVLTDEAVYKRYVAWRSRPFEQLNPGYRALLEYYKLPDTRCQLCQVLADARLLRLSQQQGNSTVSNGNLTATDGALL